MGGYGLGHSKKLLLAQAKELGVQTYPQFAKGASLISRNGVLKSYNSNMPKLPIASLLEIALLWTALEQKRFVLYPRDNLVGSSQAQQWDAETVESWILKNVRTDGARDFYSTLVGALFCCNTSQLSYLFFRIFQTRSRLEVLISTEGGALQDKFVGVVVADSQAHFRSIEKIIWC